MATIEQLRNDVMGQSFKDSHQLSETYCPPLIDDCDDGIFITKVGLYANLIMAILKGVFGYMLNSKTMMADSIHGATDLSSDILALITIKWSLMPATAQFPYGYGKIESLGGLGISTILLIGGTTMGYSSISALATHFLSYRSFSAAEGISTSAGDYHNPILSDGSIATILVLCLSMSTVAAKEWLYQATTRIAREHKSTVLASNAIHHRIDSLTEVVIIGVVLAAGAMQDTAWLDLVGGLCISLMAVRPAAEFALSALYELADRSVDDETRISILNLVSRALRKPRYAGAVDVVSLAGIKSGRLTIVDLELAVPQRWAVQEVICLEREIRSQMEAGMKSAWKIRFHVVPACESGEIKTDTY
ncbi:hypothetical protein NM208_g4576 [Fusarium decemcellulare]|uniref:Uncharacterized protein n=1 Tax=Fusarium decemcellulare TaxID=57161 RepID=A0ACC1SK57_9HYPO|nr:hypothetical protein NM208_g4576 [Fusarium decemcellulare]